MYIISQQIMYFWYQTGHLRVTPSLRFETRLSVKMIFCSPSYDAMNQAITVPILIRLFSGQNISQKGLAVQIAA